METTIQITIDKSHLTTIGEKLYGESLELLRELISNSYDADANRVWVELDVNQIKVKDDGCGMDQAGLKEYFNIGSQNKIFANTSPRFKRMKIGQFGIGKFAVLTACDRFRLYTQKNGYAAEVVFDRSDWQKQDSWALPIREMPYNQAMGDGTIITMEKLKKIFVISEIERFIREKIPLTAPHFEVYVNRKRVEPFYVPGMRFPLSLQTEFGHIQGEIIAPNLRTKVSLQNTGIEISVKGIVVKREMFEMDNHLLFLSFKLIGRVSADFLPITSDRSRFIKDAPEFEAFSDAMKKELKKIAGNLMEQSNLKAKQKTDETLKEAMSRLGKAIRKNPSFSPQVMSATGEIDPSGEHPNSLAPDAEADAKDSLDAFKIDLFNNPPPEDSEQVKQWEEDYNKERGRKAEKIKVKNLAGKTLVARRIRIGGMGIVCNVDGFGKDEKPVFIESGIIYINQDHPLYQKQATLGKENLSFYLAYLLSQQVALLGAQNDSYKAFEIQNKLLSDSF